MKIHKADDPNFDKVCRDTVINEVTNIKKLSHPNIINIVDFVPEATIEKSSGSKHKLILIIVEEIAPGGELFYFVSNSGPFSENYHVSSSIRTSELDYMH